MNNNDPVVSDARNGALLALLDGDLLRAEALIVDYAIALREDRNLTAVAIALGANRVASMLSGPYPYKASDDIYYTPTFDEAAALIMNARVFADKAIPFGAPSGHAADWTGVTALSAALQGGHVQVAGLLMDSGVDPAHVDPLLVARAGEQLGPEHEGLKRRLAGAGIKAPSAGSEGVAPAS